MLFIETPIFTKRIEEILEEEEYAFLQAALIANPKAGKLIPGGHGLRKYRWSSRGKGKRGGMRLIYYYYLKGNVIYMIYPFRKSDQEDLTPGQLKRLAAFVKKGVL